MSPSINTKQSHTSEAIRQGACQEISHSLPIQMFHYNVHTIPLLVLILSHINPVNDHTRLKMFLFDHRGYELITDT
jgi:hypothetical protein